MSNIINARNLTKNFLIGNQEVKILKDISLEIETGDFVVIFGPSGCGKSTLLHTILGLEPPTSGTVEFLDEDLYKNTTEDDRAVIRKKHIGMIYQQPNWIKALNVCDNVAFPLMLMGIGQAEAMTRAITMIKEIGMANWTYYMPTELSSGQQQKIALGRALINDPEIIIADEPTGNLDFESGQEVMKLLTTLNRDKKKTIIMVTHDLEYLKYSKTAIRVLDGKIIGIYGEKDQDKLFKELSFKRGVNNE